MVWEGKEPKLSANILAVLFIIIILLFSNSYSRYPSYLLLLGDRIFEIN